MQITCPSNSSWIEEFVVSLTHEEICSKMTNEDRNPRRMRWTDVDLSLARDSHETPIRKYPYRPPVDEAATFGETGGRATNE